jgi:hypothetical protein
MNISNIKNYISGWIIGDFEPSILRTKSFDFAHHVYPKGFKGTDHKHIISEEYNYIVRGKVKVKGHTLSDGDIFVFKKGEYCGEPVYLARTDLIIVKVPTGKNDKVDSKGKKMSMPKVSK